MANSLRGLLECLVHVVHGSHVLAEVDQGDQVDQRFLGEGCVFSDVLVHVHQPSRPGAPLTLPPLPPGGRTRPWF